MEILTESSSISPRISFSYDLTLCDVVPVEQPHFRSDSFGSNSGFEFDLSTSKSFNHESCSADELFSGGKIIPAEVKKKTPSSYWTERGGGEQEQDHHVTSPQFPAAKKQSTEQCVKQRSETEDQKRSSNSKSFWRFKRSSSLNCGSGYGRKLCPLPLLSRSNSTGSAELPLSKESRSHHHYQRQQESSSSSQKHHPPPPPPPPPPPKPFQSRLSNGYPQNQRQRPPLRRRSVASSSHGSNSSMRVNTALNVHSGNLFGLGSIIFNGKDKNRRK